jgi:hypothetical protein
MANPAYGARSTDALGLRQFSGIKIMISETQPPKRPMPADRMPRDKVSNQETRKRAREDEEPGMERDSKKGTCLLLVGGFGVPRGSTVVKTWFKTFVMHHV